MHIPEPKTGWWLSYPNQSRKWWQFWKPRTLHHRVLDVRGQTITLDGALPYPLPTLMHVTDAALGGTNNGR